MLILKLILQFVAVGFAVLTATLDYVVRDKRTLKFKRLRICLYCIAGALLIVSLAVTVSDDVVRKEEIAALRQELDRNLHTIEHVGFEFLILLPMDHPALVPYVSRISPLVTSRQLTQGPERQVQITVPFGNKSPLHPDLVTERTAYTFLSIMCLGVELFKDPAKAEEFAPVAGHSQGKGDLAYLLSRSASEKNHGDMLLGIDVGKRMFSLSASNAKAGFPQRSTGKIVSISDLAGVTAVVYFCPKAYRDEAERRVCSDVGAEIQLVQFGLNLSGGRQIFLNPERRVNKFGDQVYTFRFPKTLREIQALIDK